MFGSVSTKIHEDNMTIMNKTNTLETSFQEKIDLNAKKLEKNIEKKHDLLSQNMTKKIQNVSEDMNAFKMRLEALEQAKAVPTNSPPSGSERTTASSPPAADLVEPADPWRRHGFKNVAQNFGNLRKLDSGDSSTSTTASTTVPRSIQLQGWAKYGDEKTNVSQDEARNLAALIKEQFPAQERALVTDVLASRHLNSRASFRIKDQGENCWKIRKVLDESLKAEPILVRGIKVYPMFESPPAIKAKNRLLATAAATFMNAVNIEKHPNIIKDYRASTLYWTDNDAVDKSYMTIGSVKRDGTSWKWAAEALNRVCPELDTQMLESAFSIALSEE